VHHNRRWDRILGNILDACGSAKFLAYLAYQWFGVALAQRKIGLRVVFAILSGLLNNCANSLFDCPNFIERFNLTIFYSEDRHNLKKRAEELGSASDPSAFV